MGVLGFLIVQHRTGNSLLSALAFSIGFVALTLANSELFTENFLVPVMAAAENRANPWSVVRLWSGTLTTNLVGGWVIMGVVVGALPFLDPDAVELGSHFVKLGVGWTSLWAGILAGAVITLMTWMEQAPTRCRRSLPRRWGQPSFWRRVA